MVSIPSDPFLNYTKIVDFIALFTMLLYQNMHSITKTKSFTTNADKKNILLVLKNVRLQIKTPGFDLKLCGVLF